ncbi:hypothetical protein EDB83DRAFT_2312084 [Lactarius deliciosus]|nr:hypothetical protein EDB83DRAFT_2312084 [Lactarius deliciosus]
MFGLGLSSVLPTLQPSILPVSVLIDLINCIHSSLQRIVCTVLCGITSPSHRMPGPMTTTSNLAHPLLWRVRADADADSTVTEGPPGDPAQLDKSDEKTIWSWLLYIEVQILVLVEERAEAVCLLLATGCRAWRCSGVGWGSTWGTDFSGDVDDGGHFSREAV